MNTISIFPMIFLSLLAGQGTKKYEHSYHQGGAVLTQLRPDEKFSRAKCQLDFTIMQDSLISGRFQVLNPPSDWKILPDVTFHGVITRTGSDKSVGREKGSAAIEWKANCSFDSLPGHIKISKTFPNAQGHDHFMGYFESGTELLFTLE
ncbi:MAG: hypothetical protein Q8916_00835 [Bacteroidota bacterium]|nr:hypothetical protein [Bacteroidota bacterium]MDP4236704.1 hypothetical protein [Bacteroidota bacterium]